MQIYILLDRQPCFLRVFLRLSCYYYTFATKQQEKPQYDYRGTKIFRNDI